MSLLPSQQPMGPVGPRVPVEGARTSCSQASSSLSALPSVRLFPAARAPQAASLQDRNVQLVKGPKGFGIPASIDFRTMSPEELIRYIPFCSREELGKQDESLRTPLHTILERISDARDKSEKWNEVDPNLQRVSILLAVYMRPEDLLKQDSQGMTVLHRASQLGLTLLSFQLLTRSCADELKRSRTHSGMTALEIVEAVLQAPLSDFAKGEREAYANLKAFYEQNLCLNESRVEQNVGDPLRELWRILKVRCSPPRQNVMLTLFQHVSPSVFCEKDEATGQTLLHQMVRDTGEKSTYFQQQFVYKVLQLVPLQSLMECNREGRTVLEEACVHNSFISMLAILHRKGGVQFLEQGPAIVEQVARCIYAHQKAMGVKLPSFDIYKRNIRFAVLGNGDNLKRASIAQINQYKSEMEQKASSDAQASSLRSSQSAASQSISSEVSPLPTASSSAAVTPPPAYTQHPLWKAMEDNQEEQALAIVKTSSAEELLKSFGVEGVKKLILRAITNGSSRSLLQFVRTFKEVICNDFSVKARGAFLQAALSAGYYDVAREFLSQIPVDKMDTLTKVTVEKQNGKLETTDMSLTDRLVYLINAQCYGFGPCRYERSVHSEDELFSLLEEIHPKVEKREGCVLVFVRNRDSSKVIAVSVSKDVAELLTAGFRHLPPRPALSRPALSRPALSGGLDREPAGTSGLATRPLSLSDLVHQAGGSLGPIPAGVASSSASSSSFSTSSVASVRAALPHVKRSRKRKKPEPVQKPDALRSRPALNGGMALRLQPSASSSSVSSLLPPMSATMPSIQPQPAGQLSQASSSSLSSSSLSSAAALTVPFPTGHVPYVSPQPALAAAAAASSMSSEVTRAAELLVEMRHSPERVQAETPPVFPTKLHQACAEKDEKEALKLLPATEAVYLGATDSEGNTALHLALQHRLFEVALHIALKQRSKDMALQNSEGDNVLHLAAKYAGVDVLKAILRKYRGHKHITALDAKNKKGQTPLDVAQEAIRNKGIVIIAKGRRIGMLQSFRETEKLLTEKMTKQ